MVLLSVSLPPSTSASVASLTSSNSSLVQDLIVFFWVIIFIEITCRPPRCARSASISSLDSYHAPLPIGPCGRTGAQQWSCWLVAWCQPEWSWMGMRWGRSGSCAPQRRSGGWSLDIRCSCTANIGGRPVWTEICLQAVQSRSVPKPSQLSSVSLPSRMLEPFSTYIGRSQLLSIPSHRRAIAFCNRTLACCSAHWWLPDGEQ